MKIKKLVRIVGNLLMAAALIFLVKKVLDLDLDPSQLRHPSVAAVLLLSTVFQTGVLLIACYPWLELTRALSGTRIPFRAAMPVYTKSNLYKYVPGNVFQYVGRNQLAADLQIRHVDVACATLLDVLCCVLGALLLSAALLGGELARLFGQYGMRILLVGVVVLLLAAAALGFVFWKWREQTGSYLRRYRAAFSGKGLLHLGKSLGFYLLQNAGSAAVYLLSLHLLLGQEASFSELLSLTGAFLFAWIVGFVTPGAPGGIGIRESVMLFVCGSAREDAIVLFVLLMRISSIAADVLAFAAGRIFAGRNRNLQSRS